MEQWAVFVPVVFVRLVVPYAVRSGSLRRMFRKIPTDEKAMFRARPAIAL